MARRRIIFTNNKQSKRGIMSLVLGAISFASLIFSLISSYKLEGQIPEKYGAALVLTLTMSIVGLGLGISARRDPTKMKLIPTIGIVLCALVVLALAFLLWIGLN